MWSYTIYSTFLQYYKSEALKLFRTSSRSVTIVLKTCKTVDILLNSKLDVHVIFYSVSVWLILTLIQSFPHEHSQVNFNLQYQTTLVYCVPKHLCLIQSQTLYTKQQAKQRVSRMWHLANLSWWQPWAATHRMSLQRDERWITQPCPLSASLSFTFISFSFSSFQLWPSLAHRKAKSSKA